MPRTFDFIEKNPAGAAFRAAEVERQNMDAARFTLSEQRRKAAEATGLDLATRQAARRHLATPPAPTVAPFAGDPKAITVAPTVGPPTPVTPSPRPRAAVPGAGLNRALAESLAGTPGGGAGAVAAIQAGQQAQTAADTQQIEFETNAFAELYKGNVEAAQAWARRAGITFPPDLLANKQAAKLLGGAMTAGSKFYKNPQQLSKFVEGVVRSGGDWKAGWDAAGPPVENPTFTYQQAVVDGKKTLVQIGTTPSGAMTVRPVDVGGEPIEVPGKAGADPAKVKLFMAATGTQRNDPQFAQKLTAWLRGEGGGTFKPTAAMKNTAAILGISNITPAVIQNSAFQEALKNFTAKSHEQKVRALMEVYPNLAEQRATAIVLGTEVMKQDPTSGNITIVDQVGNTVTAVPDAFATPVPPKAGGPGGTHQRSLYEGIVSTPEATGFIGAIAEHIGVPASQLPFVPVPANIVDLRQNFETAQGPMIRGLAVNAKLPVKEIERIQKEINIRPNVWTSGAALLVRMISVHNSLSDRMRRQIITGNKRSLPKDMRQNALAGAEHIKNFLDAMGIPPEVARSGYVKPKYAHGSKGKTKSGRDAWFNADTGKWQLTDPR